jgi:hypothetical protein
MRAITRAATVADLNDLLDRVPHANLAFETPDGIDAMPVGFRHIDGQFWVGVPHGAGRPAAGTHAMLLIDDGWYYFELRGLRVRGMLRDTPAPPALGQALHWFELESVKVNAWDYGSLRPRGEP